MMTLDSRLDKILLLLPQFLSRPGLCQSVASPGLLDMIMSIYCDFFLVLFFFRIVSTFSTLANMVLNVHRNRTALGSPPKGVWRWGEREIIYLSLHCHHQNDSCIKMGSDVAILMFH